MKKREIYKIINQSNNEVIAGNVLLADSFWLRLKGLLGKKSINEDEALILYPCSEIHCYGMKFNIDAIFLNNEKKVIGCVNNVLPGSRVRVKGAKYVVELKEGLIKKKQVKRGDILVFTE